MKAGLLTQFIPALKLSFPALCLLLASCGFVPSEQKLIGTWQVDLPTPKKLVYDFRTNHTYSMRIAGEAGAMQGTWKLNANVLTMTMGSFTANGMSNPLPIIKGLSTQNTAVVRLTKSSMVWRVGMVGSGLKLRRVTAKLPSNAE